MGTVVLRQTLQGLLLRATPQAREKSTAGPRLPFHTHPQDPKPQGLLGLICQVPAGTQHHTPPCGPGSINPI